jgi:hypothetical protein
MRDEEALIGEGFGQRARVSVLVVIDEVLKVAAAVDVVVPTSSRRASEAS